MKSSYWSFHQWRGNGINLLRVAIGIPRHQSYIRYQWHQEWMSLSEGNQCFLIPVLPPSMAPLDMSIVSKHWTDWTKRLGSITLDIIKMSLYNSRCYRANQYRPNEFISIFFWSSPPYEAGSQICYLKCAQMGVFFNPFPSRLPYLPHVKLYLLKPHPCSVLTSCFLC